MTQRFLFLLLLDFSLFPKDAVVTSAPPKPATSPPASTLSHRPFAPPNGSLLAWVGIKGGAAQWEGAAAGDVVKLEVKSKAEDGGESRGRWRAPPSLWRPGIREKKNTSVAPGGGSGGIGMHQLEFSQFRSLKLKKQKKQTMCWF